MFLVPSTSMMMQSDEIDSKLDQRTLDFLLKEEEAKVAKYMNDNMLDVLKGLELIVKSQNY